MTRRELVGVLWAGGGMLVLGASVAVSSLLVEYPFFASQAVRYALATVVLAAVAWYRGLGWPTLTFRDLTLLVLLALTGLVGFNFALLRALQESEPAAVGVLVACSPLVLALVGPAIRGQLPSGRVVLAAVVVSAGAAIARGGGGSTSLTGFLFALLALAGEALFSLLAVPLLPRLGPLLLSTYVCAVASAMLAATSFLVEGVASVPLPTVEQGLSIGYLALILTAGAFLAWYSAVGRLGVDRAGLFVGLVPLSALVGSIVLGTGTLSGVGVIGAVVVGAGVVLGIGGTAPHEQLAAVAEAPHPTRPLQSAG